MVKTHNHSFIWNEPLQHHIGPNTNSATSTNNTYALTTAPFYSPSARKKPPLPAAWPEVLPKATTAIATTITRTTPATTATTATTASQQPTAHNPNPQAQHH